MSHMVTTIFAAVLAAFSFVAQLAGACPTNQNLLSLCKCEDSFSGIILECSGSSSIDPLLILRALRENRVQLGIIQQLTLQNSTLAQLPPKLFEGLYVKKLDLSNNQIFNVSSDAFNGLENILQHLILANNSLTDVPFEALAKNSLLSLVQLDLSYNQIGDLVDDRQGGFLGLPRLTDLNLANNKICQMKKDTFSNVKHTVQTLNLGANCFKSVPAPAIRGFKQLLALHLHNNFIEEIESLQFMNMPGLNLINLAKNRIRKIHPRSFLNVPNLRFMYLSDNNLTEIEPYQFHTFEKLEMLDLTRNRLQTIPQFAFAELPRLTQLYMGDNEIWRIDPGAFANGSLIILLLANNKLTSLRPDMFGGLSYLQQLSLKNNQIVGIAPSTFYQIPSLVVLDLSDNQLVVLQPATFLAQLNLFLLDLSGNKLLTVPYSALNQRIVSVLLNENPLVCTERVHVVQNNVGVYLPNVANKICGGEKSIDNVEPINTKEDFVQKSLTGQRTDFRKASVVPIENSGKNFSDSSPNVIIHPIKKNTGPASITAIPLVEQKFVQSNVNNFQVVTRLPSQPVAETNFNSSMSQANQVDGQKEENSAEPQHGGTGAAEVVEEPTDLETGAGQPPTDEGVSDGHFKIPFHTNQPILGPAFAVGPSFTLPPGFAPVGVRPGDDTYTLPPSLILATIPPWTTPFKVRTPPTPTWDNAGVGAPPPDADLSRISFYPPASGAGKNNKTPNGSSDFNRLQKTPAPKKPADAISPDAAVAGSDYGATSYQSHSSGTTTIAVCLTVVVVVLVGVFVTLCAVRHRSRKSLSSSSRTSAYVAAQAARLNYANAATLGFAGGAVCGQQGTLSRDQRTSGGSSVDPATVNLYSGLSRYTQYPQQQQNWLYGPNATYASASQYYK